MYVKGDVIEHDVTNRRHAYCNPALMIGMKMSQRQF